jgi:hypothetical protein
VIHGCHPGSLLSASLPNAKNTRRYNKELGEDERDLSGTVSLTPSGLTVRSDAERGGNNLSAIRILTFPRNRGISD